MSPMTGRSIPEYNGAMRIVSWYTKFNGSHFAVPPSSIHKMTGQGGKMV